MLVSLFELAVGVVTVVGATIIMIRRASAILLSKSDWKHRLLEIACLLIVDVVGLHLLIDPLVPGQALIHIHAPRRSERYPVETLRVLIAPVQFTGAPALTRSNGGRFTSDGTFSALVGFQWGEHRVYYRVYDDSRRDVVVADTFARVSPYARLGLLDRHIYLPEAK